MEIKDVYRKLQTLKIPVAYRVFETAPPSIPFCVYYAENRRRYGADYKNLLERCSVTIELYTNKKDIKLENKLMDLFPEYELDSFETYINEEKLYMISVSFDYIKKL